MHELDPLLPISPRALADVIYGSLASIMLTVTAAKHALRDAPPRSGRLCPAHGFTCRRRRFGAGPGVGRLARADNLGPCTGIPGHQHDRRAAQEVARRAICRRHVRPEPVEAATICEGEAWAYH